MEGKASGDRCGEGQGSDGEYQRGIVGKGNGIAQDLSQIGRAHV